MIYCTQDKNYTTEADYVVGLIEKYAPSAKTILELGCGTGAHAALLVEKGYSIHGIDMSDEMLMRAQVRKASLWPELRERLTFELADVRSYRVDQQFNVVISLFHVFSYQTTNEDLKAAFATAAHHLKPGGIFIFDFWYGPAVLSLKPEVRIKRLENNQYYITRIAEPVLHHQKNRVDVQYKVIIQIKQKGVFDKFEEVHRMRYLLSYALSISVGNRLLSGK